MLLNQDELMSWTGIKTKARLQRWLEDNGIAYRLTPMGIVSTLGWVQESGQTHSASPLAPARPQLRKT